MNLTLSEAKNRVEKLRKEIKKHDELYYIKSLPKISDKEYDDLRLELNRLEELYPNLRDLDSITQKVGARVAKGFKKVIHSYPMLSLANAFSSEDISDFLSRVYKYLNQELNNTIYFHCEPKIDGVSFSAHYKNGEMVSGATRGDGKIGEEITDNLKVIENFPINVDFDQEFEVRGEVYMKKSDFLLLNEENQKSNKAVFANPRNAASGSLRQLDYKVTSQRKLSYFVWGGKIGSAKTQKEVMDKFKSLGFNVNENIILLNNTKGIIDYYESMYLKRAELDYDIDGLVYKINELDFQERIGNISRSPRWAIAHKFPADYAETLVADIFVQVGRTGSITPVAKLKPVNIGGVLVTKASLHNEEEIIRKDIKIGDIVKIKRAGEVIPQIVEVKFSERNSSFVRDFVFPKKCPICDSAIEKFGDDVVKRCTGGIKCEAQFVERLCHFVSKGAFNIEGLSKQSIILFSQRGLIKSPADIFRLKDINEKLESQIEDWEGWGNQSAQNLFNSIDKSKIIPFNRFIYALGIRHFGEVTAELIANYFEGIDNLLIFASNIKKLEVLEEINGIGEVIAKSFIEYFNDQYNIAVIKDILKYIKIQKVNYIKPKEEGKFAGKNLIFTGTLKKYSRDEAIDIVKKMGAKIAATISKKVDYVVYGENPGSKLNKANKMNISTISEVEFLKIIGDND